MYVTGVLPSAETLMAPGSSQLRQLQLIENNTGHIGRAAVFTLNNGVPCARVNICFESLDRRERVAVARRDASADTGPVS